ncbi:GerMN domain-containing protein [Spirochaeta africana]|uniref:Sporulation/spore germination protein n=1 Tax=Spirochaeta africana (strain ATCC 700263 / DSM 8902 / Z-7692) TaxID=889378 RepID=H9UKI1_SPIAZ|nr:GerMN domain-containing protein [Spirochaeta africana]AFG38024.1 sporulation/spore germination protein [Spirochaeta africana DSM 8902]
MGRSRTRKRVSLGILFWIAFILFILVVFLFSRQNIQHVMETTGLLEILQTRLGTGEAEESPDLDRITSPLQPRQEAPDEPLVQPEEPAPPPPEPAPEPEREPEEPREPAAPPEQREPEPRQPEQPPAPETTEETRTARLYYIRVSDDGRINAEAARRNLPVTNAPLTANLRALIQGPTTDELNNGLLNLIPSDTRLLSASVNNRVAYLNFSEEFRFNSLGTEGLIAQLQQIVFTATEFSSVDRVQFLINGEQKEYLGGDGVYIGQPLGRSAFH